MCILRSCYYWKHCISIPPNIGFLEAEWSAGEALLYFGSILSFAGSIILGALDLWQNKIVQEKNDINQQKLEELSQQSNNQNIINAIIEYETQRAKEYGNIMKGFREIINPDEIIKYINEVYYKHLSENINNNKNNLFSSLVEAEFYAYSRMQDINRVSQQIKLQYELDIFTSEKIIKILKKDIDDIVKNSENLLSNYKNIFNSMSMEFQKNLKSYKSFYKNFCLNSDSYQIKKMEILREIIFGEYSLETLTHMYKKTQEEKVTFTS